METRIVIMEKTKRTVRLQRNHHTKPMYQRQHAMIGCSIAVRFRFQRSPIPCFKWEMMKPSRIVSLSSILRISSPNLRNWIVIFSNHCFAYDLQYIGNDRCVPYWWKCDGFNDCGNNNDEAGCPNNTVSTTMATPTAPVEACLPNQFMCDSGRCLAKSYVCDGFSDCVGGEDETNCPRERCGADKFRLANESIVIN